MKHIVQVIVERDLSTYFGGEDEVLEEKEAEDNENATSEEEGKEEDKDVNEVTSFQDGICALGPYGTLEEATVAAEKVLKAFTKAEQQKISFEFDELEDEVGAILELRDYFDTEDFIRRRKAGELTAEDLEEFDDD
jgi:hypothetical protein